MFGLAQRPLAEVQLLLCCIIIIIIIIIITDLYSAFRSEDTEALEGKGAIKCEINKIVCTVALNVLNYNVGLHGVYFTLPFYLTVCNLFVYRFKMSVADILILLAISVAVAAYWFYALVRVPSDIEQRDDVFWLFAKQKYCRGLVSLYRWCHCLSVKVILLQKQPFYHMMLYIVRTMPSQDVCAVHPSVCLSVCHTAVFCQNGYTLSLNFFHHRVTTAF